MPIDPADPVANRSLWIETAVLLAVTPFLLFPTVIPLLTLASLLMLALLWLAPLFWRRWPWPAATPFDLLLLAWGGTVIVSLLVTADPALSLPKATGLILGLALWRYLNRAIQTPSQLVWAMWSWLGLGLAFVLMGALSANWLGKIPGFSQLIAYLPSALLALPESPQMGVHTNQLAATLLFVLPLPLSLLIGRWGQPPRPWLRRDGAVFLLTAVGFLLLLLTQSRTGWLAFALTLWLLALLWVWLLPVCRWRRMLATAVVVSPVLVTAVLALLGPQRLQKLAADPSQEAGLNALASLSFRQEVWQWGLTAVHDFPLTGTGLGAFRLVVRRFYPINVLPSYDIAHAHNIFLQTALDVGLPGLVLYLAMVGLAFYLGLKVAKQDAGLRPYALGLVATLAAIHFFGLADALALGAKPHLLFWFLLALLTAVGRLTAPSSPAP